MAATYCTSCGAPIAEGTRFCRSCGTPIPEQFQIGVPQPVPSSNQVLGQSGVGSSSQVPQQQQSTGSRMIWPVLIVVALAVVGFLLVAKPWSSGTEEAASGVTAEQGIPALPPQGQTLAPGESWPTFAPPTSANPCQDDYPLGDSVLLPNADSSDPAVTRSIQGVQASLASLGFTINGADDSRPIPVSGKFDQSTTDAIHRYTNSRAAISDDETQERYTEKPARAMISPALWQSLKSWLTFRQVCRY